MRSSSRRALPINVFATVASIPSLPDAPLPPTTPLPKPTVLALIPARGGSKSIPDKNIVPLAGRPLIEHTIATALDCALISRVVVSTDSERIREVGCAAGAEAPFLRPAELAADDTPDLPVFDHALAWLAAEQSYEPDVVVHLRPTTPIREARHVDAAIRELIAHPRADSVRAVSHPAQSPFKMWRIGGEYLEPLIELDIREPYNQPRQSLPEVVWQNGYVDVAWARTILVGCSMTGEHILPYLIDSSYVIDIDDLLSLEIAETLLRHDRR